MNGFRRSFPRVDSFWNRQELTAFWEQPGSYSGPPCWRYELYRVHCAFSLVHMMSCSENVVAVAAVVQHVRMSVDNQADVEVHAVMRLASVA